MRLQLECIVSMSCTYIHISWNRLTWSLSLFWQFRQIKNCGCAKFARLVRGTSFSIDWCGWNFDFHHEFAISGRPGFAGVWLLFNSRRQVFRFTRWLHPPRLSGWLSIGFRNLNNISKLFNWHRPRSRLPNGSYFEASCHCLSNRPISWFVSRRGMRTPRSVLNLNINTFLLTFSVPDAYEISMPKCHQVVIAWCKQANTSCATRVFTFLAADRQQRHVSGLRAAVLLDLKPVNLFVI